MTQDQQTEPGPRELITKATDAGTTLIQIAVAAGVGHVTVAKARDENEWPQQLRTRNGLRRALGLAPIQPLGEAFAQHPTTTEKV